MTISTQKKILWPVLAMCVGWFIIFAVVCAKEGLPRKREGEILWTFSALCFVAMIVSIVRLRQCYKLEPATFFGHWHLSLMDCYAATFFSALCMALWHELWPENFLYWGASISIVAGIWLLVSLLFAERNGFKRLKTKIPMALGYMFKSYGMVALGAIGAICVIILFIDGPRHVFDFMSDVLGLRSRNRDADWIMFALRMGVFIFPVGAVMTYSMKDSQ